MSAELSDENKGWLAGCAREAASGTLAFASVNSHDFGLRLSAALAAVAAAAAATF